MSSFHVTHAEKEINYIKGERKPVSPRGSGAALLVVASEIWKEREREWISFCSLSTSTRSELDLCVFMSLYILSMTEMVIMIICFNYGYCCCYHRYHLRHHHHCGHKHQYHHCCFITNTISDVAVAVTLIIGIVVANNTITTTYHYK